MPLRTPRRIRSSGQGEFTLDPGSIAAGASLNATATIAGLRTSDRVMVIPPDTIEAGVVVQTARVTAEDTLTVRLYNPTAGAIDAASATWNYVLFRAGNL